MTASDSSKAERLITILETLEYGESSVTDLLRRLDLPPTQKRSVQRDVAYLVARGDVVRTNRNRYHRKLRSATLNPVEALAVYSAARLLFHHTAEYNEHYHTALEKLTHALPEPARGIAVQANAAYRARPNREQSRGAELAAQAWIGRQYLRCQYQRPGKRALSLELAIHFIEMNAQNRSAYAIAENRLYPEGGVRVYKISRMRAPTLLSDRCADTPEFDALRYLSTAWGIMTGSPNRVELQFTPEVRDRLLEEQISCLAEPVMTLSSGYTRVILNVGGWLELVPWILGWGGTVEVVSPPELRQHVARQVQAAARVYTDVT